MNPRRTQKSPTVEQLRGDIDRGRAADKVDHPDPAGLLGADAEAGGNPPTAEQLAEAREHELGSGTHRPGADGSRKRASKSELRSLMAEFEGEPVPSRLTEAARRLQKAVDARKK